MVMVYILSYVLWIFMGKRVGKSVNTLNLPYMDPTAMGFC